MYLDNVSIITFWKTKKKHPYKEIMVWPTTKTYTHFYISDRIFNECIFKNNHQKILVLLEYL